MSDELPPLKPCPFCGWGTPVLRYTFADGSVPAPDVRDDQIIWCVIACPQCGATVRIPGTLAGRSVESKTVDQAVQVVEPAPEPLGCHGRKWQVIQPLDYPAYMDFELEDDAVYGCSVSTDDEETLRCFPPVQREAGESDDDLCERAQEIWASMIEEEMSRRGMRASILCERWNRRDQNEPGACPFCGGDSEVTVDCWYSRGEFPKTGDAAYTQSLFEDGECCTTGPVVHREEGESDEHLEERAWALWIQRAESPVPPN